MARKKAEVAEVVMEKLGRRNTEKVPEGSWFIVNKSRRSCTCRLAANSR
jgi:hypothetical protein